jgi:type II secretory pathway pseudopilin PulG
MKMKACKNNHQAGFSLIELLFVSVILVFIIGVIGGIVTGVQRAFSQQRPRTEALNDATAALDMLSRLIRQAGNNPNNVTGVVPINPGTADANGVYRTIRIRADWRGATMNSLPDGDLTDPFEDVTFSVANNNLMKQEPGDAQPVVFLENVGGLTFNYFDTNNATITDPAANSTLISRVDIGITIQPPGTTPIVFTTSAFMRQR